MFSAWYEIWKNKKSERDHCLYTNEAVSVFKGKFGKRDFLLCGIVIMNHNDSLVNYSSCIVKKMAE